MRVGMPVYGTWRGRTAITGSVQSEKESFAETMARALGINTDELRVYIAENRIGLALLDRFREPRIAADNDRDRGAASVASQATIRARTSNRVVRLTSVRQQEPIDSSHDNQKRTADGDHVFEKGDRKIVPSDRCYQAIAKLIAAQSPDDTANYTSQQTSQRRLAS